MLVILSCYAIRYDMLSELIMLFSLPQLKDEQGRERKCVLKMMIPDLSDLAQPPSKTMLIMHLQCS